MKKLFLLFFLPVTLSGQTSNYELVFNSTSFSYVDIPNVSSVIANKTAFSISGWVNPQSDVSHSGFFGFRNNTDADFYLLQLTNTNNIEARFRNSSGIAYDIIANNALDFNQWQHLALTYDGSYIRLYKDGSLVDSTAANGIIAQNFDSFKLGALDYQGSLFHMIGNLDEIRLWDVALSANEINNWMCVEVDSTHPNYVNLMGYWNLNEGIGSYTDDQTANGNNGTLFGGTTWQASSSCLSGAILCGDVNEDGVVDQTDATEINNFILGSPPLVFNSWAADVNCDGAINILDITMLNNFIIGTGILNCCSSSVLGCTDSLACNYDSLATADDSSCNYSTISYDTIVSNISISWNGIILTTSGDYSFTLINAGGCDSIAYLNLIITTTGIVNISDIKNKAIIKITNVIGEPIKPRSNIFLFYIYDDGTVKKKIIIE